MGLYILAALIIMFPFWSNGSSETKNLFKPETERIRFTIWQKPIHSFELIKTKLKNGRMGYLVEYRKGFQIPLMSPLLENRYELWRKKVLNAFDANEGSNQNCPHPINLETTSKGRIRRATTCAN